MKDQPINSEESYGVLLEKISHLSHSISSLSKRIDEILNDDKSTDSKLDELKIEVERFKASALVARTVSGGLMVVIGALLLQLYSQNLEWNKIQDNKLEAIRSYDQTVDTRLAKIEFIIEQKKQTN